MLNWLAIRAVASNHMAICYINTNTIQRQSQNTQSLSTRTESHPQ